MTIIKNLGCPWLDGQKPSIQLDLSNRDYVPDCLEPKLKPVYLLGESSFIRQPIISRVGGRHTSQQGMENSFWFAKELALAGCVVISGLAVGIDAEQPIEEPFRRGCYFRVRIRHPAKTASISASKSYYCWVLRCTFSDWGGPEK